MHSTRYYDDNTYRLSDQYNSLSSEVVHRTWLTEHLPSTPGLACDIGAGSGRDSNWLAAKGWDVIAV